MNYNYTSGMNGINRDNNNIFQKTQAMRGFRRGMATFLFGSILIFIMILFFIVFISFIWSFLCIKSYARL